MTQPPLLFLREFARKPRDHRSPSADKDDGQRGQHVVATRRRGCNAPTPARAPRAVASTHGGPMRAAGASERMNAARRERAGHRRRRAARKRRYCAHAVERRSKRPQPAHGEHRATANGPPTCGGGVRELRGVERAVSRVESGDEDVFARPRRFNVRDQRLAVDVARNAMRRAES